MKKKRLKKLIGVLSAILILSQAIIPANLFAISAQGIESALTISADDYSAWKQAIGDAKTDENRQTAGTNNAAGAGADAGGTVLAAYDNLFGNQYLEAYVGNDGRFTMGTTGGNPDLTTDDNKLLLYGHPNPWSSFTTISVDGMNYIFTTNGPPIINAAGTEAISTMTILGVNVYQTITLINNPSTNRNDVFRISYQIVNNTGATRIFGARIMLDTMLGNNDGSPFKVPGIGDVTTEIELAGADIPQYWQSFDSLVDPNVISVGTFYRNENERPDKVQFCAWPGIYETDWNYTITSGRYLTNDSAVGIYFNPRSCVSGQSRTVTTYYGIGDFAQTDLTPPLSMRVSAPAQMELDAINGEYLSNPFTVSVHILNTGDAMAENVNVSITLPPELSLASGSSAVTIGNIDVGAERQIDFSVRAALQNVEKTVNYTVRLAADNDDGKTMTLSLLMPKVSGTQKLPVIIVPGIFGSTMKSGGGNVGVIQQVYPNLPRQMPASQSDLKVYDNWAIFAGVGDTGYEDLAKHLRDDGYKAYTCPYDWRLSLQDIVANNYLQNIIDQAKNESGQDKVILICHSMGGLVARQYIQSNLYRNDVDTLLMVGTPNNGSAFTYSIFEGGQVVDKDYHLVTGGTADATANIIINAYNSMVARTSSMTYQEIFDFVYRDKKIPSVVTLGAQYNDLLYWSANGYYSNPLINKTDFESEVAKLNQGSLDGYYQPLTGRAAGKVRTAIFYNNNLQTLKTWYAEGSSGQGNRYPDGAVQFSYHGGSWWNPFDNEYWKAIVNEGIGDKTVLSSSAVYGANGGLRWTEVPLKYGDKGEHGSMINEVDKLLRNFIFTSDRIKLDATTINNMKNASGAGRVSEMLEIPPDSGIPPYIVVNAIGYASVELTLDGEPVGYTDTYGDDQTVISLVDPAPGDYSVSFSSAGGLQHVYYTVEYFNGQELYTASSELALTGARTAAFAIGDGALDMDAQNDSLRSGENGEGYAELFWDPIDNAVSYNIYARNYFTDAFTLLANTAQTSYLTDIAWEESATVYFYVEPVFEGEARGALTVSVPNCDYTQADFTADITSGSAPLQVSFTDKSMGEISQWLWDFGDGEYSTDQNPSHTYIAAGLYSVSLTVGGASGNSVLTKSGFVFVGNPLTSIDLTIDAEAAVGDDFSYELNGIYADGTSAPITDGYLLFSSDEDVAGINGNVVTAVGYGAAVINVFYDNHTASQIVYVKDTIAQVSLDEAETTVLPGTELDDIDLPQTATVTYASGNVGVAPILWFENTEPLYDSGAAVYSRFVLTGIVDVPNDVLPFGSEPLRVYYTINIQLPEAPKYAFIITAGEGGAITSGTDGDYKAGELIEIAAQADDGYRFIGWVSSGGGVFDDAENTATTFVMPANPASVTAIFELITGPVDGQKYRLVVTSGTGGAVTSGADGLYEAGVDINIVAISDDDYRFKNWTSSNGGTFADAESAFTAFTMPANAVIVTAVFERVAPPEKLKYALTLEAGEGGEITFGASGDYEAGAIIDIAASPDDGYQFKIWASSNGGNIADETEAATSFIMPANAVTVTAEFIATDSKPDDGGTPSGAGAKSSGASGALIPVVTPTPSPAASASPEPSPSDSEETDDTDAGDMNPVLDIVGEWLIPMGAAPRDREFTDMEESHWAYEYVKDLADYYIIDGYQEDDDTFTFRPDERITRAEIIKLIVAILGLPLEEDFDGARFSDWNIVGDWAKPYIGAAVNAGIVYGSKDDGKLYVNADNDITRQEMIAMTVRALGIEIPENAAAPEGITDFLTAEGWAYDTLAFAIANDMVDINDGAARPLTPATRAEAAMMLYKMVEYIAKL